MTSKSLLDRPAQALQEHGAAAGVAGAEHAHARELAFGRKRPDHAGARGAVAAQIAGRVLLVDGDVLTLDGDRDRLLDLADQCMPCLDPAVQDADAHSGPGGGAPRPLARDLARPGLRQGDVVDRLGGQAPGGEWFFLGAHGVKRTRLAPLLPAGSQREETAGFLRLVHGVVSAVHTRALPDPVRGSDPRGNAGTTGRHRPGNDVDQPEPVSRRRRALHWVASVARRVGARPAAARTA